MISKFTRTVLLATAVIVAVPATFASAQAAPYHDNHGRRETLQHRQHAACGHIHSRHARNSCEARVAHDWQRHHHR